MGTSRGELWGLEGFEQGDMIRSLLQNDGPGVQDRLEMMRWPKRDSGLAESRPEEGSGGSERVESPGPDDRVGGW